MDSVRIQLLRPRKLADGASSMNPTGLCIALQAILSFSYPKDVQKLRLKQSLYNVNFTSMLDG